MNVRNGTRAERLFFSGAEVVCRAGRFAPGGLLVELADSQPDPRVPGCGAVWRDARVLAVGTTDEVRPKARAAGASVVDLPQHVIMPPLTNAHAHLDLTAIGPRPFDGDKGFPAWLKMVRDERPIADDDIAHAIALGAAASLRAGVAVVGDIAGAPGGRPSSAAYRALRETPLRGASFLEFFAIGRREREGIAAMTAAVEEAARLAPNGRIRLGIQPHAPYSVSPRGYAAAMAIAAPSHMPLSTHLAESADERSFIERAEGPCRELLESLGLWDDSILEWAGRGASPVSHLLPLLTSGVWTLAHMNDVRETDVAYLEDERFHPVKCTSAHRYFGREASIGPHPDELLRRAAPGRVLFGTDSIINLSPDDASALTLSIVDELPMAQWLGLGQELICSATADGARALGVSDVQIDFDPASPLPCLGAIAVPMTRFTGADTGAPRFLFLRK